MHYHEHTNDVPCTQVAYRPRMIFGYWVRKFRCPVCGKTANYAAARAICNGKRIRKKRHGKNAAA
jgi:hypothetical protein